MLFRSALGTGNVTLSGGNTVANTSFNVGGNWTNNGGIFTPGTYTVTFNGTASQAINGSAAAQSFYNIIINLTAGQILSVSGSTVTLTVQNFTQTTGNFTAPATLNINGNLVLTAGTLTSGTNINIAGNWAKNGGTFVYGTSTVTFTGANVSISGLNNPFYNLTYNHAGGTLTIVSVNQRCRGDLNITGTISIAGGAVFTQVLTKANQNLTINSNSYLSGAGAYSVTYGDSAYNLVINNSGTINIANFTYNGAAMTEYEDFTYIISAAVFGDVIDGEIGRAHV